MADDPQGPGSDDETRIDRGERPVHGAGLPRLVGGKGDRFDRASGKRAVDEAKRGETPDVDPRDPASLKKPREMDERTYIGVRSMTDVELADKVLAVSVYRANGFSMPRVAKRMKVPLGLVRSWMTQARRRKLTLPAIDAAREYVEENLVDLAVDSLSTHLKDKNLEATLATLRGTSVLRNADEHVDSRLPTTLNVQIVDANGVIISVGGQAPVLEGVIGVPKRTQYDVGEAVKGEIVGVGEPRE